MANDPASEMLTFDKLVTAMMTADALARPWRAFVGLVTLRPSEYVDRGSVYAADPRLPGVPVSQFVTLHPDDVEATRTQMQGIERLSRTPTDDEVAAWLFWSVRRGHEDIRGDRTPRPKRRAVDGNRSEPTDAS